MAGSKSVDAMTDAEFEAAVRSRQWRDTMQPHAHPTAAEDAKRARNEEVLAMSNAEFEAACKARAWRKKEQVK